MTYFRKNFALSFVEQIPVYFNRYQDFLEELFFIRKPFDELIIKGLDNLFREEAIIFLFP
ncbi:MAG: hypothetical protein ACI9XO_003214 [Paraglaciecola sp.]|jgi:hypothetical protein